jgi:MFS family permease
VTASLFRRRCYLTLSAAFFAFCAMLWVFYAWLPNHLVERFGLSMTDSGLRATLFVQLSCAAGVLTGGFLADKLSPKFAPARYYTAAAGILLSAPFGYLTFAADNLTMATVFSSAYGLTSGLMVANVFASAFDVIGQKNFGLAAGVLNMIGGFAATIMIFVAGIAKSSIGFSGLLQYVATACVLIAITLVVVANRYYVRERVA